MMNPFDKGLMSTDTVEQREIPRMLDAMLAQVSELEGRVEELAAAVSPVLLPSVPQEERKDATGPLGSPLAVNLDKVNTKLYQIQLTLRDITSRVQL